MELTGIESPLWPKTGTGSGWITTEAFQIFLDRLTAAHAAAGNPSLAQHERRGLARHAPARYPRGSSKRRHEDAILGCQGRAWRWGDLPHVVAEANGTAACS